MQASARNRYRVGAFLSPAPWTVKRGDHSGCDTILQVPLATSKTTILLFGTGWITPVSYHGSGERRLRYAIARLIGLEI